MESIANALKPGSVLEERYKIEAILGEGGFGITYKAHDAKLDCIVVIKEFLPNDFAARANDSVTVQPRTNRNDDFQYGLKSFLEEARTLARFQHSNIVAVTNFIEANGSAYFVMNYAEGIDLGEWLKARTELLDETTILDIITPILDGLAEVHKTGLMHRDIKPGNIYLRNSGGPMLIDFGAARQALGEHSKSISAIISQGYAPPEQYTTRGKQGPYTDLYAIGATMYKMIVGQSPIESSDRSHAKAEGESDPMRPAIEAGKGKVSDWLLQLTDQLLNISAKDRPQSAESVLEAIKNKTIVDMVESSPAPNQTAQKQNDNKTRVVRSSERFNKSASKTSTSSANDANSKTGKSKTGMVFGLILILAAATGAGWWFTQNNVNTSKPTVVQKPKTLGKGQAILYVESEPDDAEIYLDNILLGRTPYNYDQLPSGKHELKLVHKSSMDLVESVSLNNNEITKKKFKLDAAKGKISVFSTPSDAAIYLGNKNTQKRTPATLEMAVGEWQLELKKDAYYSLKVPVTIIKGKTTRQEFSLKGGNLVEYKGEWLESSERDQRIIDERKLAAVKAKEAEGRALKLAKEKQIEEERTRALIRRDAEISKQQEVKNNIANAGSALKAPAVQGNHSSIKIKAPDIAENGAVIPVTLSGLGLKSGEWATLETDMGCSLFRVTNKGRNVVDYFATRIKLPKSQEIIVRVNNGNIVASKLIKVTIGGVAAADFEDDNKRTASWSFIKEAVAASGDFSQNDKLCRLTTSNSDIINTASSNGSKSIRMRASLTDNIATIKALVSHPMETGLRKDRSTGKTIPEEFIQALVIQSGYEKIYIDSNAMISKNPYFSVQFNNANKDDVVTMAWVDNNGASSKSSSTIK